MDPFVLEKPADTRSALGLARTGAPTHYLAGGTQLLDLMKLGVVRPTALVHIGALRREHGRIEFREDGVRLGALVTMAEAAGHPRIRQEHPALAQSLRLAASPQIRNMASLAGNVLQRTRCPYFRDPDWAACNKRTPGSGCAALEGVNRRHAVLGVSEHCIATYPGDFGVALAAFGATVELLQPGGGPRTLPFEELHRLPGESPHLETQLGPGEFITAFFVPAGAWTRRSVFIKIRDREAYDFALASAVVGLGFSQAGTVEAARVGLGGLAAKPWRSHPAEEALLGRPIDEARAWEAADAALAGAAPRRDNAFKVELGRRTLVRAILAAAELEP